MGISRIIDPLHVKCSECEHRKPHKQMNPSGKGWKKIYYCNRLNPPRRLYGQRGCSQGGNNAT